MDIINEQKIREKVRDNIKDFVDKFEKRYMRELTDPTGVINAKKNNAFVSELGNEFMFYSAFCRSFDSSFGKVLEKLSNDIADISYEVVLEDISSYLLPEQIQRKSNIMNEYDKHVKPKIQDYTSLEALLDEYFILKNALSDDEEKVRIYLATAYNMFGEDNEWRQERVKQYFSDDELLIGKQYWNFVCDDENGYNIIIDEYKMCSRYILDALERIKNVYFN